MNSPTTISYDYYNQYTTDILFGTGTYAQDYVVLLIKKDVSLEINLMKFDTV